ncbi:cyclic nucleotide-binding domain-containing protein [Nonomuraea sp. NPDC052116]|uniref:cyclic nucleotide-binding domain-containing protein n=1 Tax=Nonomuraea sp. NPDC052116 TaxID=3155665 RepID=UPI0034172432
MLTPQEQSTLRARSSVSRYGKDTVIVAEGTATSQVTVIRSGWAKGATIKADRPVLLRLYGPGELIGVSAALTGTVPAETVTITCYELHAMTMSARSFADFYVGPPMPPLPCIACRSGGWRRLIGCARSAITPPLRRDWPGFSWSSVGQKMTRSAIPVAPSASLQAALRSPSRT